MGFPTSLRLDEKNATEKNTKDDKNENDGEGRGISREWKAHGVRGQASKGRNPEKKPFLEREEQSPKKLREWWLEKLELRTPILIPSCRDALENLTVELSSPVYILYCHQSQDGVHARVRQALAAENRHSVLVFPVWTPRETIGLLSYENLPPSLHVTGWVGAVRNLLAVAAQLLRQTRTITRRSTRLEKIFKTSILAVYTLDFDGNIVEMNPSAARLLGYPNEELPHLNVSQVVEKNQFAKVVKKINQIRRTGQIEPGIYQIHTRDGRSKWIEAEGVVVYKNGCPHLIQGVAVDITWRVEAEKRLRRKQLKYDLKFGKIYLLSEGPSNLASKVLRDLDQLNYDLFVISREDRAVFVEECHNFTYLWLANAASSESFRPSVADIQRLVRTIPRASVVMVHRADYLVSTLGFETTLNLVQDLRETALIRDLIIIVAIDPVVLAPRELRCLELETEPVQQRIKTDIPKKHLRVLRKIYEQNIRSVKPSITQLARKANVSLPTCRKRVRTLKAWGLLEIQPEGRSKHLQLTWKGLSLFD